MKENRSMLGVLLVAVLLIASCTQGKSVCSDKCKAKKESQKEVKMAKSKNDNGSIDNQSEQLVCKLIGAEKAEKKELLKKEIFSQVTKVEEINNGYILNFEDKDNILLKLTDYLMIEKECCPFFVFDLNIQPNSKGISLKISGQEGAKDMLKPLVDEIKSIK
jgi:hypothetical protein